jgi:hypothetical protein
MDFVPRTKHILPVLLVIALGVGFSVGVVSSDEMVGAVLSHTPLQEASPVSVSSLSVGIDSETRALTRMRIAHEVGKITAAHEISPPPVPVVSLQDEAVSDVAVTTSTSEEVTIAPSVVFCTQRDGRVAETFSPQGVVTVVQAEGARVITQTVEESGVSKSFILQVPEIPTYTENQYCIDDTIVGIGLDGRLLYAGIPFTSSREGLVGYARDGFGIFAREENGGVITTENLDACHGHTHTVVWDGFVRELYHYHITDDAPYTLGCYRGVPAEG